MLQLIINGLPYGCFTCEETAKLQRDSLVKRGFVAAEAPWSIETISLDKALNNDEE